MVTSFGLPSPTSLVSNVALTVCPNVSIPTKPSKINVADAVSLPS
jgi:hypothetical protein